MDSTNEHVDFVVRQAEPGDYEAMHRIFSGPKVIRETLQLPFPSLEMWRKRMAEPPEGGLTLLACVKSEVVGQLGLHTLPNRPRRRHVGHSACPSATTGRAKARAPR